MFLKPSIAVGTSITNVFDTYTCVDLNGNNLSALNLGFCGIIRRIPERLKKLQDCDKMRVRYFELYHICYDELKKNYPCILEL